jgi:ABC-2 type transport system permease protein
VKSLFERIGIDYDQWKVLTRTALKIDFRGAPSLQNRRRGSGRRSIIFQMVLYSIMGLFVGILLSPVRDLYLGALILVAYTMFMIGTAALLDYNATIVSPDDYAVLGFRPVSSRTYFAARLANVLVYTTLMTALFGWVPVVFTIVEHGVLVGAATLAAVFAGSATMALAMVAVYAWILRALGPRKFKLALTYVQLASSTLVYGGYFLISRVFTSASRSVWELHRGPWLIVCPPAWFASYVDLASGSGSRREAALALLSIVVLGALGFALLGRLSLTYAEELGAVMTAGDRKPARPSLRRGWLFQGGESRAVALLVWSQFRNDTKFQMGVLAILPMTILYLFMGLRQGEAVTGAVRDIGRTMPLVSLAMLLFPSMLKSSMVRSDAFRASWIFFVSPSDRARLLRSAQNVLVITFLVPYILLTGAAMVWFYHQVRMVVVHLVVIGLLSHLLLQLSTLIEPELPFSKPIDKGLSSARIFAFTMLAGLAATVLALVTPSIYGRTPAVLLTCGLLLAGTIALDRWMRLRVEREAAGLEFLG